MNQRHSEVAETQSTLPSHHAQDPHPQQVEPERLETVTPSERTVPATPSVLATQLQHEARLRRREQIELLALSSVFVTVMAWIISRLRTDPDSYVFNLVTAFVLLMVYAASICLHLTRRSYRRKGVLMQALAQSRDIQQIGPLVQTLWLENTPVRNLAKGMLIDLLPNLQASDATLLGDAERDILLRHLTISPSDSGYRDLTELFSRSAVRREIDLRLSILKALEQVGGARELGAVERLSRGRLTLNSSGFVPLEVQEAARQCLPFLQSRAAAQLAGQQLLRASSAAATTGEALLRPARAIMEDNAADQLVRAVDSPR
jgi:hypothetical protein